MVTGTAPSGAARLALGLAFEWPALALGFEVRGIPPVTGDLPHHALRVSRLEGTFLPCVSEAVFFVCGLLSVGGMWTELTGTHHEQRDRVHWSGGGRAGAELAISSRLSLAAHVDVEGAFRPTLFRFDKAVLWREAVGQLALGFTVIGTLSDSRP